MKIRRLDVRNFRGIKELAWTIGGDYVCLVGPGDSTKSTVLDAIELVLSPRWNISFYDSDFYLGDVTDPLVIRATVGDIPDELLSESKFGLRLRGWSGSGELHDEPETEDEPVLSIELRVDASLEPAWYVVNDREASGARISADDRARLGVGRLGALVDRHFTWAKGSVLSRVTGKVDDINRMLAEAGRAARVRMREGHHPLLTLAAKRAQETGASLGVRPLIAYQPHLDAEAITPGVGGLALHDGDVPVRRAGLGTRRLLAVGLQFEASRDRATTLIDEIEHGLEPHRIRQLIHVLRSGLTVHRDVGANASTTEDLKPSQVFMTTHSRVAVAELRATELRVVRSAGGTTWILDVPTQLQALVRSNPEALLGRRIVVCEGKTELGLCRALDLAWQQSGPAFAYAGVVLADGGGTNAPSVSRSFRTLGFEVSLLADTDVPLAPDANELSQAGVQTILWDGGVAVEERIMLDLPWVGVVDVVKYAADLRGLESARDAIATKLGVTGPILGNDIAAWLQTAGKTEREIRVAAGKAAKGGNWFKRVDLAEELGRIVVVHLGTVPTTDLATKIGQLKTWAHGNS
ncbi:MAG: AAA family ATPase [Deltaproteobacteria bacterium]|nr:AAA family ATPase [Deltaproteobacteria bacterium]